MALSCLLIAALGARLAGRIVRHAVRAQLALADQHRIFQQLLHSTLQGCWFIDTEGRTTDVNPAMCQLLGRPREELIGRSAFDFFEGDSLRTLQKEVASRHAGEGGQRGGYEVEICRPDGTRVTCHNNATAISDAQGRPLGSVGLWTDLTPHIRTERELRTYAHVTNAITDVVSVIDEDEVYQMVNDAWCRSTGIARVQALGRTTAELLPSVRVPQRRRALLDCLASGMPLTVRGMLDLPSLHQRLIETTFYPCQLDAGPLRCVVMVSRDITEQQSSQAALATSAQYLRRTLSATTDGIFASDARTLDDPVRFVNPQLLQLFHIDPALADTLTPRQLLNHAMPMLVDPDAQARRVREIVEGNLHDESRVRLRDGRVLLQRCVQAQAGEGLLRVWSLRDITAEERALQAMRDSDAELRALLAAFPGYIAAFDQGERFVYVNDRVARLLGRPHSDLLGRHASEVFPSERLARFRAETRAARSGAQSVGERSYPATPMRPQLDMEITHVLGPPRDDGSQTVYAFGIDITARKRAEEALIAARDEAERANRAKSRFLSQMSHELRTPMNAILGFAELLHSDPSASLSPSHRDWTRQIVGGATHLLELINELLDLGSIDAGDLQVQQLPVALQPLVDECLSLVRSLAAAHQVHLEPCGMDRDTPPAMGDRKRIKQVLLNLLGNAIKYNHPQGVVTLRAQARDGQLVLEVQDTGPGLSRADQERLFMPFERLAAGHGGVEGTGLGLALSRHLVEAMGGGIGVHSQPGAGSTFWFSLPLAGCSAPLAATLPALPAPAPAGRLPGQGAALHAAEDAVALYIDDNPVNLVLMEAMLERLGGLRVLSAHVPEEGLALALRERPDLILLDIQMPGMNGFDVLRRLRAAPGTRHIPVVAVSANAQASDVDAALAAGFDDYLSKPLTLERLAGTVRSALQHGAHHTAD
jgi:PAS domain S-box-containing protein